MGVSELARLLGLGKSTVHLLLSTLTDEGLVEVLPGSRLYRLGLGTFELGAAAVDSMGYGLRLTPPMERLLQESNEAISLAVLHGDSVIFVQRFESSHILRTSIRPGTRMPLHASASGKVFLAAMPESEIDRLFPEEILPPSADKTIRTKRELKAELARVRQQGYATNVDEWVNGIAALATPVRDRTGRVVAALSIAGPTVRFDPSQWVCRLLEATEEISRLLGNVVEVRGQAG